MGATSNKSIVQQFIDEVYNNRNIGSIDELVHEDFIFHNRKDVEDLDDLKVAFVYCYINWNNRFDDLHYSIQQITTHGNTVMVQLQKEGTLKDTHSESPSGKRGFSQSAVEHFLVEDGKIRERWTAGNPTTSRNHVPTFVQPNLHMAR